MSSVEAFVHEEPRRAIVFGPDAVGRGQDHLTGDYTLLSTERALAALPELGQRAARVAIVPPGRVDEVAGGLRHRVRGDHLVALGGGRVIDTAKALAAADPPRRVTAIPTTLSAAEMTGVHRQAAGARSDRGWVRPSVVLNDPGLSASAPRRELAASAANALAHASVALSASEARPLVAPVAATAVRHLCEAWATDPDREQLALGALLAGWAVDHTGLGLHHALAQTLVRVTGSSHAQSNAALLPFTLPRPGEESALLALAAETAFRLRGEAVGRGLRDLGLSEGALESVAAMAAERPEVRSSGSAGADALLEILREAW